MGWRDWDACRVIITQRCQWFGRSWLHVKLHAEPWNGIGRDWAVVEPLPAVPQYYQPTSQPAVWAAVRQSMDLVPSMLGGWGATGTIEDLLGRSGPLCAFNVDMRVERKTSIHVLMPPGSSPELIRQSVRGVQRRTEPSLSRRSGATVRQRRRRQFHVSVNRWRRRHKKSSSILIQRLPSGIACRSIPDPGAY